MAKIGLSEGFSLIPKGTHVFQITAVNYKEDFGKMEVTMQLASGQKHTERFSLLNKDGEPNEGGLNAFSYFAKAALNDFTLSEIDHEDLVGCFIKAEVTHEKVQNKNDASKTMTFSRLGSKYTADGFEEAPATPKKTVSAAVKATATPTPTPAKKRVDLASILGKK